MKKDILSKDKDHESGSYVGTNKDGEKVAVGYVIERCKSAPGWTVTIEYFRRMYLMKYTKVNELNFTSYTLGEAKAIAKHEALYFKDEIK